MPLEGHYERVNTPLRQLTPRERGVAIWGVLVTAISILALILATAGDSQPAPPPGCIRAPIAGRTGAELISACGTEAVKICERAYGSDERWAESVSNACLDARIRV
jgi:hypothetical protein